MKQRKFSLNFSVVWYLTATRKIAVTLKLCDISYCIGEISVNKVFLTETFTRENLIVVGWCSLVGGGEVKSNLILNTKLTEHG